MKYIVLFILLFLFNSCSDDLVYEGIETTSGNNAEFLENSQFTKLRSVNSKLKSGDTKDIEFGVSVVEASLYERRTGYFTAKDSPLGLDQNFYEKRIKNYMILRIISLISFGLVKTILRLTLLVKLDMKYNIIMIPNLVRNSDE